MTINTDPLIALLREHIRQSGGRIPFADLMSLALYEPQYGYYSRETFALGEKGDFTTASESSPLFARCLARQCETILAAVPGANILELGAGTGRFAGDVLSALMERGFAPQYYIYDISPNLRKKQRALIEAAYPALLDRMVWIDALPKDFCGMIIANEVLDALPVHCFRLTAGAIQERSVAMEQDQVVWIEHPPSSPGLEAAVRRLQMQYDFPEGYASEINLNVLPFMRDLSDALRKGVLLITDYGYGESEYYHPARNHGTLTCFHAHRYHDDPLIFLGQQDITAHVDFSRVLNCAEEVGFALSGYNTQALFLLDCGLLQILAEAESHLSTSEQFKLHQAVKMLTLPTEMGERVKVMALHKNLPLSLQGFKTQDLRRQL
jgi:SAM-dependent MidA family methyltransferase